MTAAEVFSFELKPRFQPTAAKLDADGANLLIRHAQKGWYRFTRDGDFIDKPCFQSSFRLHDLGYLCLNRCQPTSAGPSPSTATE